MKFKAHPVRGGSETLMSIGYERDLYVCAQPEDLHSNTGPKITQRGMMGALVKEFREACSTSAQQDETYSLTLCFQLPLNHHNIKMNINKGCLFITISCD